MAGKIALRSLAFALLVAGTSGTSLAQTPLRDPNLPGVKPEALEALSDTRIRQQIMLHSQQPYQGRCVCPRQTEDSNGRSCKGRYQAIRTKPKPLCTPEEVSEAMIENWRQRR